MEKILIGTSNPHRIKDFSDLLAPLGLEILTLNNFDLDIDVVEDGETAQENAIIKSKAYFEATGIPTISVDAGVTVEKFPPEKQPGLLARRIANTLKHTPTDQDVIDFYVKELENIGGVSDIVWEIGMSLTKSTNETISLTHYAKSQLTAKHSKIIQEGNPLFSLQYLPEQQKFISDLTVEEYRKLDLFGNNKLFELVKENSSLS